MTREVFTCKPSTRLAIRWRDYPDVGDSSYACGSVGDFSQNAGVPMQRDARDLDRSERGCSKFIIGTPQ